MGAVLHGLSPGRTPQPVLKPQPPDHPDRFPDDSAGHFRAALKTVGENDRYFHDPHSLPPKLVRHLDLKAVAVGADVLEIDGLQRAAAKTFVAAGRVGERHAGDE